MSYVLATTAAAGLLAATASVANAQAYNPLTDARSVYDWSGFYLGIQAGWGWSDQDIEDSVGLDGTVKLNGGYFGPVFGFQKQWNNWVLGAEVDANWSDIDGQDTLPGAPGRTFGNIEIFGSAGAKLGYAWDRVLFYGIAGAAGAETGTLQRNGPASTDDHAASFGWMAGGGVDFALTTNVIVGLQYKHYNLGEADFDELAFVPDRVGDTHLDTVSGHFNVKFGGL